MPRHCERSSVVVCEPIGSQNHGRDRSSASVGAALQSYWAYARATSSSSSSTMHFMKRVSCSAAAAGSVSYCSSPDESPVESLAATEPSSAASGSKSPQTSRSESGDTEHRHRFLRSQHAIIHLRTQDSIRITSILPIAITTVPITDFGVFLLFPIRHSGLA